MRRNNLNHNLTMTGNSFGSKRKLNKIQIQRTLRCIACKQLIQKVQNHNNWLTMKKTTFSQLRKTRKKTTSVLHQRKAQTSQSQIPVQEDFLRSTNYKFKMWHMRFQWVIKGEEVKHLMQWVHFCTKRKRRRRPRSELVVKKKKRKRGRVQ